MIFNVCELTQEVVITAHFCWPFPSQPAPNNLLTDEVLQGRWKLNPVAERALEQVAFCVLALSQHERLTSTLKIQLGSSITGFARFKEKTSVAWMGSP